MKPDGAVDPVIVREATKPMHDWHAANGIRMLPGPCRRWVQRRGLQEFQRRAGYVSARISAAIAINQGIYIPRSPFLELTDAMVALAERSTA